MEIKEALEKLDHANDEHWTAEGAPVVKVVADMVGNDKLKRKDITDAAPHFMRKTEDSGDEPEIEAVIVESIEDAMEVTGDQLMADRELFEIVEKVLVEEIENQKALAKKHSLLVSQIEQRAIMLREFRKDTERADDNTKAYQKAQFEVRMNKAVGARQLLASAGVTASNVREALDNQAPIDKAFAARKAAPGTKRPQVPMKNQEKED